MIRFALALTFCFGLLGCAPSQTSSGLDNQAKINAFRVNVTSSTEKNAIIEIDFDITAPREKKIEANLVIRAPNVSAPMMLGLADKFPDIAKLRMTGWKDNTLVGTIEMKDGKVFSGTSATIPNLFSPPETTYQFELFIREGSTAPALALEKRTVTIR